MDQRIAREYAKAARASHADLLDESDFYRQHDTVWAPLEGRIRDDAIVSVCWLEGTMLCYQHVPLLDPERMWSEIAKHAPRHCVWVSAHPLNPDTVEKRGSASDCLTIGNLITDLDTENGFHRSDKGVLSWQQALDAIEEMRKITAPAIVIESGGGIHTWVPIEDHLDPSSPLLERWKAFVVPLGCDPTVPADPARILRPAGTLNHKLLSAVASRGTAWGDGTGLPHEGIDEAGYPTWRGTRVSLEPVPVRIIDELSEDN
ncbi:hypothetical protein ABE10_11430 [Bacillus toyonensis]|nr:hypothetical protein [Bacillus toyonensis]